MQDDELFVLDLDLLAGVLGVEDEEYIVLKENDILCKVQV